MYIIEKIMSRKMFAYAKFRYNTIFLPLLSDISIAFSIITFGPSTE